MCQCAKLRELIAALSTCLVGVEARCGERQLRGRVAKVRFGPNAGTQEYEITRIEVAKVVT